MKNATTHRRLAVLTSAIAFMPLCIGLAADTAANAPEATASQPSAAPAPIVSTTPAPTKLPYGVEDVLKLSRAQISEEIILNYVQNSGTIYNLTPKDIVYLKNQGVSDKVITVMLDQRKRVEFASQSPQAPASMVPNAPIAPDANMVPAAPTYPDSSATYAEAPLTPPASTTYVIPYPTAGYPYYGSYGYPGYYYGPYGYYGGYWGPSVAFGFGFGGRGYYHGGFHGGRGSFGVHGGFGGHHR